MTETTVLPRTMETAHHATNQDDDLLKNRRIPDAFDPTADDDTVLEAVASKLGFLGRLRAHPLLGWVYRAIVGLFGGAVVVLGLVLVPLPGPGWAVVFLGLAILATEFAWAKRMLEGAKKLFFRATRWLRRRSWWTRGGLCVASMAGSVALCGMLLYVGGWGFPLLG